jgi:hypothetical protein
MKFLLLELPKTPKTFFLDGVCLSEAGLGQIRALSMKLTEKKQRSRWKRTPSVQTHPALLLTEKSEDDIETPGLGMCLYVCMRNVPVDADSRHVQLG